MEDSDHQHLPYWGILEIHQLIEFCESLIQQNTRKNDSIFPDLDRCLKEFRESLQDAEEEVENRGTRLYIGHEEFIATLRHCEEFLRKAHTSPRPEEGGFFRRRRSSQSEFRQREELIQDLRRLIDRLHSHARKLDRYLRLVERQVGETNVNQLLSLLQSKISPTVANVIENHVQEPRHQIARSDYSAPAGYGYHPWNEGVNDNQSIKTTYTQLLGSDDGIQEVDKEIHTEVQMRVENWRKRYTLNSTRLY
jgi:hypothetical protein